MTLWIWAEKVKQGVEEPTFHIFDGKSSMAGENAAGCGAGFCKLEVGSV